MPHSLDSKRLGRRRVRQLVCFAALLELPVEPLVLKLFPTRHRPIRLFAGLVPFLGLDARNLGIVLRQHLLKRAHGRVANDVEHGAGVAQREPAVVAHAVLASNGRADEVPLREIFNGGFAVGANDAVGLEEQHAVGAGELFPEPGLGEEDADGLVGGEICFLGEKEDPDALLAHEAAKGRGGRLDPIGAQGEEDDGPFGTEELGKVEHERDEVGDFRGVGFHDYGGRVWEGGRWWWWRRRRRRRVERGVEGIGEVEAITGEGDRWWTARGVRGVWFLIGSVAGGWRDVAWIDDGEAGFIL